MSLVDYPWLQHSRAQFARLHAQLPHALLVYGRPGLGKQALALEIVSGLLCESSRFLEERLQPCGSCKNCEMFKSLNHPDFHFISSELNADSGDSPYLGYTQRYLEPVEKRGKRKPRKVIAVDQIRSLIDKFSLASHSAENKVALIGPAEAMNINASNALLKLLEEPSPGSILILVCNDLTQLPMTIRSRCISLSVGIPDSGQILPWLEAQGLSETSSRKALAIAGGSPLLALKHARSDDIAGFEGVLEVLSRLLSRQSGPVETRESLLKLQPLPVLLAWLQMILNWLVRSIQDDLDPMDAPWHAYQRYFVILSRGLDGGRKTALFALYDELLRLKQQDLDIVNPSMLLDRWLISFSRRLA